MKNKKNGHGFCNTPVTVDSKKRSLLRYGRITTRNTSTTAAAEAVGFDHVGIAVNHVHALLSIKN